MNVNPYIFREYDIRGVVEEDFKPEVVELLGKGFGTFVKNKDIDKISLGGDVRLTTKTLKESFAKGVLSTGVSIIDLGIIPTPISYFSIHHLNLQGAVQITGSHNPPEFNGFKMTLSTGAVYGEQIMSIKDIIDSGEFAEGKGVTENKNITDEYCRDIVNKIKLDKPLKIITDCGNGAGGLVAPKVLREIGCEVDELFTEPDGNFPNHHPDPTVEKYIKVLIEKVRNGNYDFGVAFDGDMDRIGVVDNKGEIVWADYLMALLAEEVLADGPKTIIFDVKCSQGLAERIVELGGKPLMYKTGHSLIKEKLKELDEDFAGEMSGHIFFGDEHYGYDDALYVAARLARLMSRTEDTISEKMARLPKYYSTPEMRLNTSDDKTKFEIVEKAVEYFTKNFDCDTIDGVRIQYGDGWGLVRASNTQPVIVVRFEARTEKRLNEIKDEVIGKLMEYGEIELD
ncbi:phosphomannomutase/phosphoglucomutase [Candidatus Marinimicrobia bacterium MT.SAG.4]|nr:phosphomannomutase/phosphoglucomutase [Candidatus Marinimicrobia bacterium MT.SAG.4]